VILHISKASLVCVKHSLLMKVRQ